MTDRLAGRRLWGIALAVLAVSVVGTAAGAGALDALTQPSGETVLDGVEDRYNDSETYVANATVTVSNGSVMESAQISVAYAEPNSTRVVVTANGETYRAGTNGTVVWAVGNGTARAVEVDTLRARWNGSSTGDTPAMAPVPGEDGMPTPETPVGTAVPDGENVTASVLGTTTHDGAEVYEVRVTHPNATGNATLLVDTDDYRVHRVVATDGTNRTVVDVTSQQFNASVHASTFQPPTDRADVATTDRYDSFAAAQDETDLALPRVDGEFQSATVAQRGGETVVAQQYHTDSGNVTVATTTASERFDTADANTTRTVGERTVGVRTTDEGTVAYWTDGETATAVVVEGDTERALAIVETVA